MLHARRNPPPLLVQRYADIGHRQLMQAVATKMISFGKKSGVHALAESETGISGTIRPTPELDARDAIAPYLLDGVQVDLDGGSGTGKSSVTSMEHSFAANAAYAKYISIGVENCVKSYYGSLAATADHLEKHKRDGQSRVAFGLVDLSLIKTLQGVTVLRTFNTGFPAELFNQLVELANACTTLRVWCNYTADIPGLGSNWECVGKQDMDSTGAGQGFTMYFWVNNTAKPLTAATSTQHKLADRHLHAVYRYALYHYDAAIKLMRKRLDVWCSSNPVDSVGQRGKTIKQVFTPVLDSVLTYDVTKVSFNIPVMKKPKDVSPGNPAWLLLKELPHIVGLTSQEKLARLPKLIKQLGVPRDTIDSLKTSAQMFSCIDCFARHDKGGGRMRLPHDSHTCRPVIVNNRWPDWESALYSIIKEAGKELYGDDVELFDVFHEQLCMQNTKKIKRE